MKRMEPATNMLDPNPRSGEERHRSSLCLVIDLAAIVFNLQIIARCLQNRRKKARKPPVVLAKQDIRRVIEASSEPTKSIVTLNGCRFVADRRDCSFALGKNSPGSSEVVERFYEGEFDDTKTNDGRRNVKTTAPGARLGSHLTSFY